MKILCYKSIDVESHGRHNKLIIRGVKERGQFENCAGLVFDFLANIIQIDVSRMIIACAHQLGAKSTRLISRPIIANFMNYNDVGYILSNAQTLKTCPGHSIDRNFPKEIVNARKRLWSLYKDTKKNNPGVTVCIVYPAKLFCGNIIVKDEFPQWNFVLSQNRLTCLDDIVTIQQETASSCNNVIHGTHNSCNETVMGDAMNRR